MPWYVLYDYVEVFTYDADHNQFVFHWRDDFDSFDSGKWHKASGGFDSNTSVFHPANVYTTGGHLVHKMEPEHSELEEHEIAERVRESFGLDIDDRTGVHRRHRRHAVEEFNKAADKK